MLQAGGNWLRSEAKPRCSVRQFLIIGGSGTARGNIAATAPLHTGQLLEQRIQAGPVPASHRPLSLLSWANLNSWSQPVCAGVWWPLVDWASCSWQGLGDTALHRVPQQGASHCTLGIPIRPVSTVHIAPGRYGGWAVNLVIAVYISSNQNPFPAGQYFPLKKATFIFNFGT